MLVALGAIDPGSNPGRPTIFHRTNLSRLAPPLQSMKKWSKDDESFRGQGTVNVKGDTIQELWVNVDAYVASIPNITHAKVDLGFHPPTLDRITEGKWSTFVQYNRIVD